MSDYDFKNINGTDFEELCVDLLSEEFKTRLERFKPGRDNGVDGRFFINTEEAILQCKHWRKSGYNQLLTSLKNSERPKVDKLEPKRYIFATTISLTRNQKIEILETLSPHIKSESDIFGAEDINDLLKKYPNIEKNHFKLWIQTTTVMTSIFHNGLIGRKQEFLKECVKKSFIYVETGDHREALNTLRKHHVVILTGLPGIGKTTLAEQLCLNYHVKQKFDVILLQDSISDGEKLWNESDKQVFMFDDFLGSNYLSALSKNEDSHIVNFINRIKKSKSKRFILTSRNSILSQGYRLSQRFTDSNLSQNEFEVSINSSDKLHKARILYNHICSSDLSDEYIDELYKAKRYHQIINHQSFNPRLISYITDAYKVNTIEADKYWSHVLSSLNNPRDIWSHTFDNQLDETQRWLTFAVFWQGGKCNEKILTRAYYRKKEDHLFKNHLSQDFISNIKICIGATLNREIDDTFDIIHDIERQPELVQYSLFNPSISDYLLCYFRYNQSKIFDLLSCLQSEESIDNLINIYELDDFHNIATSTFDSLISEFLLDEKTSIDYRFRIASWVVKSGRENTYWISQVSKFIKSIIKSNFIALNWTHILICIKWALDCDIITSVDVSKSGLFEKINVGESNYDDLLFVNELIKDLQNKSIDVPLTSFTSAVEDAITINLSSIIDRELRPNDHEISYGPGLDEIELDRPSIETEIHSIVQSELNTFEIDLEAVDIDMICEGFDLDEYIKEYLRDDSKDYDEWRDQQMEQEYSLSEADLIEEIDYLFMRD